MNGRLTRVGPGVDRDLVSGLVLELEHLRSGDDSAEVVVPKREIRSDEAEQRDEG